MTKAVTIALHEYRVMIRRRSFLILTLLFPLLGLLAVVGVSLFQGRDDLEEPKERRWGYVDHAGILEGEQRVGRMGFLPFFSNEEALAALLEEEIRGYVVLPADYLATGLVAAYTTNKGLTFTQEVKSPLGALLVSALLEGTASPDLIQRVGSPVALQAVRLDEDGRPLVENREDQVAQLVFFTGLAILLLVAIFMSSGFLLQGIGEEKENRIMEVLLSSVTPWQLLAGKIVGLGGAGLTQVVVWVASALVLLRFASVQLPVLAELQTMPPLWVIPLGLLFFFLGYLLFATLMAGLGALTTTAREGQQISGIFVLPPVFGLEANTFLLGNPENPLVQVLSLLPITSPFTVMQRLALGGIGWWELVLSAGLLGASVVGALWLAAKLFRAYLLMYGRRPGFRELWGALRG